MANYLDSFISILPQSQKDKLLATLNVDGNLAGKTEQEYDEAIKALLAQLGKKELSMMLRPQAGQTDSEAYNQTMREIITDLHNIFQESDTLDKAITNHHYLNIAVLSQIQKDLKRLEDRIDLMNLLADNNDGFVAASHDTFIDNRWQESRTSLSSSIFGNLPDAERDDGDDSLKLGTITDLNRINANTKIEVLEQTGEGFKKDRSHPISLAIDTEPNSFWGEVILSDEPLKVPLGGADEGAICRFKITFPAPCTVSYVALKPYTQYLLDVVSIGYTVDSTNYIAGYIPIPEDKKSIELNTVYTFPAVNAQALIITIRQKHATRNIYTVSRDRVNDQEMWSKIQDAEREEALSKDLSTTDTNLQVEQKVIDSTYDTTWVAYQAEVAKLNDHINDMGWAGAGVAAAGFIAGVVTGGAGFLLTAGAAQSVTAGYIVSQLRDGRIGMKEPERVTVDKYEYVYGMYDVAVKGLEYKDSGIYISKPHPAPGGIMQVALDADEWHPTFVRTDGTTINKHKYNDPLRRTSIEYSVTYKDRPTSEADWFPILPLGQTEVNTEFLVPASSTSSVLALRFPADPAKPVRLYKNEELITQWDWFGNDYRNIMVPQYLWNPNARWTIDYSPSNECHVLDFTALGAVPTDTVETFQGTAIDKNGRIKLSQYPYTNFAELRENPDYNPVQVTIQGNIQGKGGKPITAPILSSRNPETIVNWRAACLNVTNYEENTLPELDPYNPRDTVPTFEYAHEGNYLYLPESFNNTSSESAGITHGDAKITVNYQYLVPGVRLRVVLRRTSDADKSVTPALLSYTLKFKCTS